VLAISGPLAACSRSYHVELMNASSTAVNVRIVEQSGERATLAEQTIERGQFAALGPISGSLTNPLRLEARPARDQDLPASRLDLSPGLTEIRILDADGSDWRTVRLDVLRLGGYRPGEGGQSPENVLGTSP